MIGLLAVIIGTLPVHLQTVHQSLMLLSNGFIVTSLLWGSLLASLIDRKPSSAALYSCLCGVLAFFEVIHSIRPTGEVYLPWQTASSMPYMIAVAYFLMAGIFLLFRIAGQPDKTPAQPERTG